MVLLNSEHFHNYYDSQLNYHVETSSTQLSTVSFSNFDFLSSDRKPEIGNFTEDEENIGVTVPVSGVPSLCAGPWNRGSGIPDQIPPKFRQPGFIQIISCSIIRQTPSYCQFAIEK